MRAPFAALTLAFCCSSAHAAEPPPFRLCTGPEAGNYFKAGHVLKAKAQGLRVEVVPTQGSLDNLDKVVAGQCEGAFVQADALLVYSARKAEALSTIERAGVYGTIPAGTYPAIQPSGRLYGTRALDTTAVDALFVTALPWVGANERAYDSLLRAFTSAKPQIAAIAQPQE